ncbi:hypothetical protein GYMLUDRAFT_164636 [Collybiopsis luxurians FD-317 M1]|uniref:Uncharacterized protein n=1 Tax=Collybiopsis luxurians FD-317 M1 TaxID=944289 RepID=A0A0D0BFI7_9AGAR|nr:hypothetical protein GYMLUDRAFT_164636 [Collybiopsis luxurians FD-317 M1]
MLSQIEPGMLLPKEVDLISFVVVSCKKAFAWTQSECGSFSQEYYPDYEIPTIEYMPWQQALIWILNVLIEEVKKEIKAGVKAGRFKPMTFSY